MVIELKNIKDVYSNLLSEYTKLVMKYTRVESQDTLTEVFAACDKFLENFPCTYAESLVLAFLDQKKADFKIAVESGAAYEPM